MIRDFKLKVSARSDSDFAEYTAPRKSCSGCNMKLEDCPDIVKSGMQRSPTSSVCKGELVAGVTCAQDMMFIENVLESIDLEVELHMILELDNKDVVDLMYSYVIIKRIKHIEFGYLWLKICKRKESSLYNGLVD